MSGSTPVPIGISAITVHGVVGGRSGTCSGVWSGASNKVVVASPGVSVSWSAV